MAHRKVRDQRRSEITYPAALLHRLTKCVISQMARRLRAAMMVSVARVATRSLETHSRSIERSTTVVAQVSTPSLYDQLGGNDSISAVVGDFYGRVLADDTLSPLFTGVDLDRLRRHQ